MYAVLDLYRRLSFWKAVEYRIVVFWGVKSVCFGVVFCVGARFSFMGLLSQSTGVLHRWPGPFTKLMLLQAGKQPRVWEGARGRQRTRGMNGIRARSGVRERGCEIGGGEVVGLEGKRGKAAGLKSRVLPLRMADAALAALEALEAEGPADLDDDADLFLAALEGLCHSVVGAGLDGSGWWGTGCLCY